ncbi:MAG: hypothetical protein HYX60_11030, partial [Legionella longbeachae]|nr:hypothetical protein [Legionella longbeachae]
MQTQQEIVYKQPTKKNSLQKEGAMLIQSASMADGSLPHLTESNFFSRNFFDHHPYFAKRVHESGHIYGISAFLDSEILTYSGFKSFFDIFATDKNSLRDWLKTPEGLAIASVGSIGLLGLSYIANASKKDDPRAYRQNIMALWPYFRNVISEIKSASKSARNTLKIAALFNATNLNHLMLPLGLTLATTSVLNRIWFGKLQVQRKKLKKELQSILNEITTFKVSEENCNHIMQLQVHKEALSAFYKKIPSEYNSQQGFAYLSAAYNGLIDGLAYYIAAMTLVTFTSPAFIPIAAFCVVFSLASINSRIYEEYEYQRDLEHDILLIKLNLKRQEIKILNQELTFLTDNNDKNTLARKKILNQELIQLLADEVSLSLQYVTKPSLTLSKAFSGLKKGLSNYAFVNKMFMTSLVFFSAVPAALLLSNMIIGLALLVGFTMYSMKDSERKSKSNSFYNDWLGVVRAFVSGINKGQKLIAYILTLSFLEVILHNDLQKNPI